MEKSKAKCSSCYGMFTGIYGVVALGVVLGVLLGLPFKPEIGYSRSELAALLAIGIAVAYAVLAALDWLAQTLALAKNPLPQDLDLSDRGVAREQVAALAGNALLQRHIRRLLIAWAAGASGPQVATMAANQMIRMLVILAGEAAFIVVLLAAAVAFYGPSALHTLGTGLMALVALIALARFQLASKTAGYIESHLLARIGNDTPAAAGAEFAQTASKSVADSMAALAAAQAKFVEQLAKSQDQAAALAAKAQQEAAAQLSKAHADAAAQIAKAQTEAAAQIAKAQQDASAQVAKAQQESAAQIAKAQGEVSAKLTAAQQESAAQIAKTQDKVAEQLGRVSEIAASIDKVFKLQQAVDGTLKGVAVTDEFKSTLVELKRHLAESDQLLKNAAKPRTIRLVEKDNE